MSNLDWEVLGIELNADGKPSGKRTAELIPAGSRKAFREKVPLGPAEAAAVARLNPSFGHGPDTRVHQARLTREEFTAIKAERAAIDRQLAMKHEHPNHRLIREREEANVAALAAHQEAYKAQEQRKADEREAAENEVLGKAIEWAENREQNAAAQSLLEDYRRSLTRPGARL